MIEMRGKAVWLDIRIGNEQAAKARKNATVKFAHTEKKPILCEVETQEDNLHHAVQKHHATPHAMNKGPSLAKLATVVMCAIQLTQLTTIQ